MNENERPDLSIVIAWQLSQRDVLDCLESIYNQESHSVIEVILVYGGFEPDLSSLSAKYPHLIIMKHPNSGSLPSLHGLGIEQATGKFIAITEGHTTFAANWIDIAVSASSDNSAAAIGGVVEPGRDLLSVDFALYLCDYAQFALPMVSGVADDLPGNNIVFKRDVIEAFSSAKDLGRDGFWKTFFCHELEKQGKTLWRDAKMVAFYNRHLSLGDVMLRRYHHGRCFGAMRSSEFTAGKKALYAASCGVLPIILCKRLVAKVVSKPSLMRRFALVYPICYLIVCAWVQGEYYGTALGAAGSCDQL
jgi:hypothetical protein